MSIGNFKHGATVNGKCSPEWNSWYAMKRRCEYTKHKHFKHYGGRGIRICGRWQKFENFFSDMGPRPTKKHTLDRIDNNGNYEPGNCRWATQLEQQQTRRNCVHILLKGNRVTLSEAARQMRIPKNIVINRRKAGIPQTQWFKPILRCKKCDKPFVAKCGYCARVLKTVDVFGEKLTIAEASKKFGLSKPVLLYRINNNWPSTKLVSPVWEYKNAPNKA